MSNVLNVFRNNKRKLSFPKKKKKVIIFHSGN